MAGVELDLSQPERKLKELGRALRSVEDGKQLRKDLMKNLRAALKPAVDEAKSNIRSMPAAGLRHGGASLRNEVAKKVSTEVRLSGRSAGARVKAKKTTNVRGFATAPKRLNRAAGWRHPFFGNKERWYSQRGKPGWFDRPMQEGKRRYRDAVLDAMDKTAREVARRVH